MNTPKRITAYFCAIFLLFAASGCIEAGRELAADIRTAQTTGLQVAGEEKQVQDAVKSENNADNHELSHNADKPEESANTTEKPAEKTRKSEQPAAPAEAVKPEAEDIPAASGEKKDTPEETIADEKNICTIAIYGDDYTILKPASVEFKDGDTVLEVLKKITRGSKIHMEYRGREKSGAYVEGIDNLYEFDRGVESGWMYNVNGIYPNYGCGAYKVKKGDVIEWRYTKDLGKDLGVDMKNW